MKLLIAALRTICLAGIIYFSSSSLAMAQAATGTSLQASSNVQLNRCASPADLHITNLTTNSGLLVWKPVIGTTGYIIRFRAVGSTSWIRQTSENLTEVITGLVPNTLYEAKVRSNCGSIVGNYSPLINFTTLSNNICNLPNVYYYTSNNITSNSCRVGWQAVAGATGYNVHYRIRYSNAAWISGGSSSTTSILLTGLSPQVQYEFQVQTICSSGTAPFSTSGIFTTQSSTCGTPSGLASSNITTTSAKISWNSLACASYYTVSYRPTGQSWITDTTSFTYYSLSNLAEGAGYEYRVQSVDAGFVISSYSAVNNFTTASATCGVPLNLASPAATTSSATLTWNAVGGVNSYLIRYRLAGAQTWQTTTSVTNSITVTGLSPDNAYEFQVQSQCSASTGSYSVTASFITMPSSVSSIPVPDHIVICIMENKAYTQLMNNSLTPYINSLANQPKTAVFTESYGITHPSQPNYIHLFSGANQGVTDNNLPGSHFNTPNLAKELLNAGRTFVSYCEALPSVGFDGASSGRYQRKHNPLANWMGTGSNQVSSTLNKPFTSFPQGNFASLPTVSLVVPDMTNSMHDGVLGTAIATGDSWLANNMNAYIQWARTNNSIFILTTDEDDGAHSNRILTIITGGMVTSGYFSQPITHHSVLRTIAEMYGLNFIGASANASPISGCWTNGFRMGSEENVVPKPVEDLTGWKIYPNPAHGEMHVNYELKEDADVLIRIYSNTGSLVMEDKLGAISKGNHVYDVPLETRRYPAGIYFMDVTYGSKKYVQRFLISQ